MDVIFNIKQVVLHSRQPNTTRLFSVSSGLDQVNPSY